MQSGPSEAETPRVAHGRLARRRLLSDTPLRDKNLDYFDYGTYAEALADVIESEGTDTPLTIAVSAPWGAGKTSVARILEALLGARVARGERPNVVCWFNAWMHTDAPHLGAAMAAHVARHADRHRPVWKRLIEPLPGVMLSSRERWRRGLSLALIAVVVATLLLSIGPVRNAVQSLSGIEDREQQTGSAVAALLLVAALASHLFKGLEQAARFVDSPAAEAGRGSMAEVRRQLGRLISQAVRNRRLIVFVDDLERCSPDRAIEICEVANQLLSQHGVITVFIADMELIARSAAGKYSESEPTAEAGRLYLEKIVQLQLALPPPRSEDMGRMLRGERPTAGGVWPFTEASTPDSSSRVAFASFFHTDAAKALSSLTSVEAGVSLVAALAITIAMGRPLALGSILQEMGAVFAVLITATVLVWGASLMLARPAFRRRSRRTREEIKQLIDERLRGAIAQGDLEQSVVGSVREQDRELAGKLVRSYLVDSAHELRAVEEVILNHPPALPRGAKRMLNHARLLTQIARVRGLFGGAPELSPAHLGKWIVLCERWPDVARKIERNPDLLADYESRAAGGSLHLVLDDVDDLGTLRRLLSETPRLAEVSQRLVHFEPAAPYGTATGSAAGSEAAPAAAGTVADISRL
jgi:KAP family P-loop domain